MKQQASPTPGRAAEGPAKRDRLVKVYLTDAEYAHLDQERKEKNEHLSLSAYARSVLLQVGNGRYPLIIQDDDLQELNQTLFDLNLNVNGFIAALRYREELYQDDADHLGSLLTEINDSVRRTERMVYQNRHAVRKRGQKILERQIRSALKTEEPSTTERPNKKKEE